MTGDSGHKPKIGHLPAESAVTFGRNGRSRSSGISGHDGPENALGRGGELERLSGRTEILRLPSPKGWDGNGVGRRFFMFPAASLSDGGARAFLADIIQRCGRALYLTSDDRGARRARELIRAAIPGSALFSAREIESSKEAFVRSSGAVAVIANRYDGIDFPNEECRLLIVEGRPGGASLQERFLADKLGARVLFAERIRTRIVQAFGRCTRSANDYAIVIALGDQLIDELALQENLSLLDTELQAEIRFGEAQSKGSSAPGMLELAKAFLQQGAAWRSAEQDKVNLRDDMREAIPLGVQQLQAAAPLEIEYITKLWSADFSGAIDAAQRTLTALAGGDELRGYRAWWHYLAGCAAQLEVSEDGVSDGRAIEHFRRARSVGGVRWLSRLQMAAEESRSSDSNSQDAAAVEALEGMLCELGLTHEARFAEKLTKIRAGLNQAEAARFEAAHVELGRLLGFQSDKSDAEGAPDPWWLVDEGLCFVFEDHSGAKPGNELSLEKARQASSHPAWIRQNLKALRSDASVIPVLVTPSDVTRNECQVQLKTVAVWPLEEFRAWADQALKTIREIRSSLPRPGDLVWRSQSMQALAGARATPSSLAEFLETRIASSQRADSRSKRKS